MVATGAAEIEYSVGNPQLFRIDRGGNVYTNTNGRQLMLGGLLNFTVLAINPGQWLRKPGPLLPL